MSATYDYLWNAPWLNGGGILAPPQAASPPVGGLLSTASTATPPGQPTFLSGLTDFFQSNPAMISQLAAGIGSAPTMRAGIAQAAAGMPQAMQFDQTRQGQKALGQYFQGSEAAKSLSPGMAQLLSKYPALAEKYALQSLVPTGNSSAYTDYLHAKSEGYTGKFVDYQKEYGQNRAAETWSNAPQPILDADGNVKGLVRTSDRAGIQWLDSQFRPVGPIYHPGDPGYPSQVGGAAALQPQAPGASAPATASGGNAFPDLGGNYSPPGSAKIVNQGTQQTIVGPTGVPRGTPLPINNTQESADKSAGVDQATDLKTANNNSLKATTQKNSIALMRQASQDKNFYSGFAADPVLAARKMAVALGADPGLAASMENFQSMSNQLVKDRLGSLGTGVSNADVGFISRTVPTLEATPQGNQQLLDILDKLADRDIEIGKVAQQYAKDHGGGTRLDAGWSTYLADWAQAHPLFSGGGGGGASSGGAQLAPGTYNYTPQGLVPAQ